MATSRGTLPGRVKPESEKLAVGRHRKMPPADAADVIRHACATGANRLGVAIALGVSGDVLTRWLDESPELKEAFDQGREKERQTLHNVLYDCAVSGNGKDSLIASMFLLKSRHGYVEGQQESQANRVSINFQIPAATPLEKFMVIDDAINRAEPVSAKLTRNS